MPDLTSQAMTLPALERGGGLWIRSTDLARALGYGREDKVARLYSRHADEFTNSMTQVVEIVVEPHFGGGGKSGEQSLPLSTRGIDNLSSGRMRIFSLRGCHLVAMLARTPVAKEFRRWVLSLLENEFREQAQRPMLRAFRAGKLSAIAQRWTPERKRLVGRVLLFREAGDTYRQIAAKTGMSAWAVGNIVRRYFYENASSDWDDIENLERLEARRKNLHQEILEYCRRGLS